MSMVLEFMDGGSLADVITKQGPQAEGDERRQPTPLGRSSPWAYSLSTLRTMTLLTTQARAHRYPDAQRAQLLAPQPVQKKTSFEPSLLSGRRAT